MRLSNASGRRSGNVALTFALLLPVLLGAAGAGVDLAHYASARAELQEIADAAAIAGAREYLISRTAGAIAEDRAEHSALSLFMRSEICETPKHRRWRIIRFPACRSRRRFPIGRRSFCRSVQEPNCYRCHINRPDVGRRKHLRHRARRKRRRYCRLDRQRKTLGR